MMMMMIEWNGMESNGMLVRYDWIATWMCMCIYSSKLINEKLGKSNGGGGSSLKALKSKYPASCFLLTSAQMPLWSLTFNGLSRFGKIA